MLMLQCLKEHKRSKTHGFFALMGGFVKYGGDNGPYVIDPNDLKPHLREGDITKEAIKDKSKGDLLSKGFAILQTGWFILQCIARKIQGLPITELEIVTLGFAALNFATYALWWNKPLDVRVPFVVRDELGKVEESGDKVKASDVGWTLVWSAIVDGTFSAIGTTCKLPVTIMKAVRNTMRGSQQSVSPDEEWSTWQKLFFPLIFLAKMGGLNDHVDEIKPKSKRVPTFYAGELKKGEINCAVFVAMLFATIFGAIHCIAWSFDFPSPTEQLLWRISSLAITSVPVLSLVIPQMLRFDWGEFVEWVLTGISLLPAMFYIVARVTLLVIAFTTLRSLPPDAYHTVNWTTFIPHI
jgi:hypothetical protein